MHASRRSALLPNAAPRATTAITNTITSTAMAAAAVSVAIVEDLPTTSGASAALAHRRCGRVSRQRFTFSSFLPNAATCRASQFK
jgi:hypothetical protein